MTWKILNSSDNLDIPDATIPAYYTKQELHGASFICDSGEGDSQFIAFQLQDGRTAKLLSFDLQETNDGINLILWEGN